MTALAWSAQLELHHDAMDRTHREFVELLDDALSARDDDARLSHFRHLLRHTDAHFGQEDRWMRATGFAPQNCHALQHAAVLGAMREGVADAERGDFRALRETLHALAVWFPMHAQSMDAALASHLDAVGFDPETGALARPPSIALVGCGGTGCG